MNPTIQHIVTLCDDKKATNIAVYPVLDPIFADYTVICTASNSIQIKAIASELHKQSRESGFDGQESIQSGNADSGWIIVEVPGLVSLHITLQSTRDYYDLDGLFARRVKSTDSTDSISAA